MQFIKYQACVHLFAEYLYDFRSTSGPSMLPTFAFQDDWVIISKRYGRGRGIKVGDIVSFWIPIRPGVAGIKRVIGMPGDFVLMNTPGSGSDQMIQVGNGLHCPVQHQYIRYNLADYEAFQRCLKDIVGWLEII